MNGTTNSQSPLAVPAEFDAMQAVRQANALFGRHLAAWSSDLLELRRRGLGRPAWQRTQEPPPGSVVEPATVEAPTVDPWHRAA